MEGYHPTGLELINTHIFYVYVGVLPTIFNSDLRKEQEAPRGYDGFARINECVHASNICMLTWQCFILQLNIFIYGFCNILPLRENQSSSDPFYWYRGVYWENNTCRSYPAVQSDKWLGIGSQTSSSGSFCLTPALTFHPGSMSQAGRAVSVTNPLDCSDKDEGDIWTPRGKGGTERANRRTNKELDAV